MKLGRFVSEVYRILIANQNSTAGEVFVIYRTNYPNTIRSRNEVAKRISELLRLDLVGSNGSTVCGLTGRRATRWIAYSLTVRDDITLSTEKPEQFEQFVSEDFAEDSWEDTVDEFEAQDAPAPERFSDLHRDEKARRVSELAGEKCVAMDPEDEHTLQECRFALKTLVNHHLFKTLAPAELKEKAKKLEHALRYF